MKKKYGFEQKDLMPLFNQSQEARTRAKKNNLPASPKAQKKNRPKTQDQIYRKTNPQSTIFDSISDKFNPYCEEMDQ